MRKYAIILAVLTLIGIGLTALLYTQDEKLDQTVFIQTTESIRNLQNLDKNLLVMLSQSRFNNQFDHEILFDKTYELSEEFSNLRYDALFEEIEASPELSDAIKRFDERYASREEELEIYAEENQLAASALASLGTLTGIPESKIGLVSAINAKLFALTIEDSIEVRKQLDALLTELDSTQSEPEAEQESEQGSMDSETAEAKYRESVSQALEASLVASESYRQLSQLETGPLLDDIEKAYVNYHNQAIKSSNQFKVALIVYGVILLVALVFFAAQIRKNFLFLEQEVADRTAEIKTAYEDLQESQEQLIQSEKMASLGQMVAGVAHEINTPLGINVTSLSHVKELLVEIEKAMESNTLTKNHFTNFVGPNPL